MHVSKFTVTNTLYSYLYQCFTDAQQQCSFKLHKNIWISRLKDIINSIFKRNMLLMKYLKLPSKSINM